METYMNNKTQDQPASVAAIAKFFASPWVSATIIMVGVFGYKMWRAGLAGRVGLTPRWFMPIGAFVAAIGWLVMTVTASRREHAFFRATLAVFAAFVAAVLFVMLRTTGATFPDFGKTVLAVLFMVGSRASAVAAKLDNQ